MPPPPDDSDHSGEASAPGASGSDAGGTLPKREASERIPFAQLLRRRVAESAFNPIPYVRPGRASKVGAAPGDVSFVGEAPPEPPRLSVIDYSPDALAAYEPEDAHALRPHRRSRTTTWINLEGLHDPSLIREIGEHFGLHPLVMEDIANAGQRPKVETFHASADYEEHALSGEHDGDMAGYFFVAVKMLTYDEERQGLSSEHVSIAAGPGWLISFQERPGDVFDPVRHRLRDTRGRLRHRGADYLAYTLLDVIVDHYFLVLEAFGTRTEEIEEEIVEGDPSPQIQQRLNALRRDLILMRRAVWPTRDLFAALERGDDTDGLIADDVRPFLRDTYDHAVQVMDILESLRDVVSGLGDLYMSSLSHRMNEVMQVLTIIGTIFIPLTFIAGIYGMNFEYMPELGWHYSYFVAMGAMGLIGVALVAYFHRKGWL